MLSIGEPQDPWGGPQTQNENFMGKLVIAQMKGGQRNIWIFEVYFGCFQALRAPMEGGKRNIDDLGRALVIN